MTINPVTSLFSLYLFANFVALIQGISDGGLVLEWTFFDLKASSLAYSFLLQSLILLAFLSVFKVFHYKLNFKKITYDKNWGWFLVILQTTFLIFNLKTGVNIAGAGARIEGGSLVNYMFILLQPDMLFVLIGVSLLSDRLFFINVIVFLTSMVLRGWMGGFFIVIFTVLVRYYPVRISMRNLSLISLLALFFVLMLPAIIDIKWAMRQGVSAGEFFSGMASSFSAEKYSFAISYLLNRFQHLGHVALLFENSDKFYSDLSKGVFSSYWMDGLPQYTVSKFFGLEHYKLNSYMVEYFFGINEPTWNTNPGISGWLFILQEKVVFMVLYFFIVVVVPFFVISRYAGNTLLMLLACFSITYLFHGWFGAYFNTVFYALLIILINKLKLTSRPSVDSLTNIDIN